MAAALNWLIRWLVTSWCLVEGERSHITKSRFEPVFLLARFAPGAVRKKS
jgi:hypothetical protein